MADFQIPCDVFVRLASILTNFHENADIWNHSVRIDGGVAVATNRHILAAECIGGAGGVIHIKVDPVLIEQCRKEAPFKSLLHISVNEPLKWAMAKTTLGYVHPENAVIWSDIPNEFDRWRDIAQEAADPNIKTSGAMFWCADDIARLASSSPSGRLVFAEKIDVRKPSIIRDIYDPNWFALFIPYASDESYRPATLPDWIK